MRITVIISISLLSLVSSAQVHPLSPELISVASGQGTVGEVTIEWTAGELAVASHLGSQLSCTEGFHQPILRVQVIPPISKPTADTGLQYTSPAVPVHIYPNPVKAILTIQRNGAAPPEGMLRLFSLQGKPLLQQFIPAGEQVTELDLQFLSAGLYLLQLAGASHEDVRVFTIAKIQ